MTEATKTNISPLELERIHWVWLCLRQRCNNPRNRKYKYYGARGIKVCERWNSFENFLADMGPRPTSQHQIERENNNDDYCPNNCRWATRLEQAQNKSNTILVDFKGEQLRLDEVAQRTGIKYNTLYRRWHRGRSLSQAIEMGKPHG